MKTIFIPILLLTLTISLPEKCKEIIKQIQNEGSDPNTQSAKKTKQCFSYLIEKGQYDIIDDLEDSLDNGQEKIMTQLLQQEIQRLQNIQEHIIQAKSTCEPVLKWAQNLTHIFVAAKLSHRWDSPPCLRTLQEKYELVNSTLKFKNTCIVSRTQVKFSFEHNLYKKSKNSLDVKKDGVGQYSLIFEKENQEIWPYLFQNNQKIPIWLEVMNRNSTLKTEFDNMMKKIQASAKQQPKNWISLLSPELFLILVLVFFI